MILLNFKSKKLHKKILQKQSEIFESGSDISRGVGRGEGQNNEFLKKKCMP